MKNFTNFREKRRSSRLEVFCKKGALKNLAVLTGKRLCWSLYFNFIKKRLYETLTQVFFLEYCEIVKNNYFEEHLRTTACANGFLMISGVIEVN